MDFEWDDDKRLVNLEKHGIDFFDARTIWAGEVLDPVAQRHVEGEARRRLSARLAKMKSSSRLCIRYGAAWCA